MQYLTHEACLAIPDELNIKTMNTLFPVSGANDFNIVISRADLENGELLEAFYDRLSVEWEKELPQFKLRACEEVELAGQVAKKVYCSWQASQKTIHQLQLVALSPEDKSFSTTAVIITATTLTKISSSQLAILNGFLQNWQWRFKPYPILSKIDATTIYFAYREMDNLFIAFNNLKAIKANLSLSDIKRDLWRFYDVFGNGLEVIWQTEHDDYILVAKNDRANLNQLQGNFEKLRNLDAFPSEETMKAHLKAILEN